MAAVSDQRFHETGTDANLPPGTFQLIRDDQDENLGARVIMLDPIPSSDPNEPLNWTTKRKAVNFVLVMATTCAIFTALSIQPIFWQLMVVDLNVSFVELNRAMSVNFVGLAMGCIIFIPFARKYGRRPIYLISALLMTVTSFWFGSMKSVTELYVINLLQGLAGATNETLVQVTVADLFFVHHRGGANGLYMGMVMCGSFLTPIGAGTQAQYAGWRGSYRTLGITNAILFGLFVLFYEETKYTKVIPGVLVPEDALNDVHIDNRLDSKQPITTVNKPVEVVHPSVNHHKLDHSIPLRSWRQRLALSTPTDESIWPYFYRPFVVLFTFPAVMFSGLQYASGVVWLTVLATTIAIVFPGPPYYFTPVHVAYLSLGPFIGNLIGAFYGGYIGDRSILYFSRKNKGLYEPEMRLYILHLPALAMCAGMIMFGVTISKGMHWIYPSVAGALFGFGLGSIGDASLTFVIDSYKDVTGDAFTAVAFMRNAISIGIPFSIAPWMQMGLTNMYLIAGFVSLGVSALFIPMIIYGKMLRVRTAPAYAAMSAKQGSGS